MSSVARPLSRRARFLAPLAVAASLVGGMFALSSPGSASTADEATLASLVNGARAAAGLPSLAVSGALSDVARSHSAAMASSGTLSHSGNLGSVVGSAVSDWTNVGENVAVAGSVTQAHQSLMASAEHRATILGDYTVLGVGVVTASDGRVWVTELFAKTATAPAPAPAPAPTVTEPVPAPTEPAAVPVVDTTVASAAVAPAPAPAPKAKAASSRKPVRRAAAPAAVVTEDESCLPPQAQGHGHAYGRCDDVPRGSGGNGSR